jgi:hypothetical protein
MARELGQERDPNGIQGHFVCVDGFGPESAEERAAGLPQHGEARALKWDVTGYSKNGKIAELSFRTHLPLVQENFSRTFRVVDGENVIYVDTTLDSELGFDRPVSWAEHFTLGSPFLAPAVTQTTISGTRAQTRPYTGTGNANAQRRLAGGRDFVWPNAPLLDGTLTDLTAPPEKLHFLDHATILVDPANELGWVATVQTVRHLIIGYVFRRADYPWVQNWGNYPDNGKLARGLEISSQPYDEPRRDAVAKNGMFGASTFRWLSAKSSIHSSFLIFYARTSEDFSKVTSVRLEGGKIRIQDQTGHTLELAASLPLSRVP